MGSVSEMVLSIPSWLKRVRSTYYRNRIGGVIVSMFSSSAVDRGFEPRSDQTKDYETGICCYSGKHAALRRKNKEGFALNQDNVSEWGDMSICRLLFQWASTIKKSNLACWSSTKWTSSSTHGKLTFILIFFFFIVRIF